MPSRVLLHLPPPEPPRLVDRPPRRPARGEEFPAGWTVADYQLERGEFAGEEYAFEVWVIPLLAVDEGPATADPAPGGVVPAASNSRCTVLSPPCRPSYGYQLTPEDGDRLVAALTDAGTHASLEAAAAIRWGEAMEVPVDDLEPELCRAILDVLDRASTDLEPLRERLSREAAPPQLAHTSDPLHPQSATASMRLPRRLLVQANGLGTRDPLVRPAEAPHLRVAVLEAELAGGRGVERPRAETGCLVRSRSVRLDSNTPANRHIFVAGCARGVHHASTFRPR